MGDPRKWDIFEDGFGGKVRFPKVTPVPKAAKPKTKTLKTSLEVYREKVGRSRQYKPPPEVEEFQIVECPTCAKRYGMKILATGLPKTDDKLPLYPCEQHRRADGEVSDISYSLPRTAP